MAMIPRIMRGMWDDDFGRPSRLLDQNFGLGLLPQDFMVPLDSSRWLNYYRPWRSLAGEKDSGSTIVDDKDKFQVNLDVQHFAPEEITVKATGDNTITIEGKHEEKQDEHGFISRHFVRKYTLPQGHDFDQLSSSLSSDGVLSITAPKMAIEAKGERVIPIAKSGPAKAVENKK